MQIKKISEDVTYKKINTEHAFELNGKEIRVYDYAYFDSISNDYDNDVEIDERDKQNLTDEELELIDDNINDLLELKDGEITEII